MSESVSLFAYGSFTQGMIHRTRIDQYVASVETAYIDSFCYLLPVGYPVLAESSRNIDSEVSPKPVRGELLTITAPQLIFTLMDEFHGVNGTAPEKGLHFKKTVDVKTNSSTVAAISYLMNPSKIPRDAVLLEDGDWQGAMKRITPKTEGLNFKQIDYLRKLGNVKGRSLIPYDLNLSRELMKLDLIVDKGRRLALTKLGKEVLRYIPE